MSSYRRVQTTLSLLMSGASELKVGVRTSVLPFINEILTPLRWMMCILHLAGIGIIFTRSREGTQLGRLTQNGQTNEVFDTMWHHAGFWLGELGGRKAVAARERTGHWVVRVALCISTVGFVYSPYQYYCCYCLLCLLFCWQPWPNHNI